MTTNLIFVVKIYADLLENADKIVMNDIFQGISQLYSRVGTKSTAVLKRGLN